MGRKQMIAFTRGMANGAMKGRTVVRSCGKCGLGFPKYVGRYPTTCPQCKGSITVVAEAATAGGQPVVAWGCTSMVPRIQKILDAGTPADAPCERSSKSFVVRYDEMARQLPGGVHALTNFMEGPDQGRFYRVESPDQPVLVLELDAQLERARLFSTDDPARYLGNDPRAEFVDSAPPQLRENVESAAYYLRNRGWSKGTDFKVRRSDDTLIVFNRSDAKEIERLLNSPDAEDAGVRGVWSSQYYRTLGYSEVMAESQLHERGGAGGGMARAPSWDHQSTIKPLAHEETSRSVIGKPRKAGEGQTSPYGGFRIHVGGDPNARARNRKPRMDMQRALQNKRNARRGLAKRVRAAKDWHASPAGERLHRALGRYNKHSNKRKRNPTRQESMNEGRWGGYVEVTHDEWQSLKSVADTSFRNTRPLHNLLSRAWSYAMRDGFPVALNMQGPTGEDEAYALQKVAELMFKRRGYPSHQATGRRVLQQMHSPLVRESLSEVALLQSRQELEQAIYKAKVGKAGIDAYSLTQMLKNMDDDALLHLAQRLGLAEAARRHANLLEAEDVMESAGQEIWRQLRMMRISGFPLLAFLGAKNPAAGPDRLTVTLRGKWKGRVVIKYDRGRDLYNVTFGRIRMGEWIVDAEVEGIDVGNLSGLLDRYVHYGEAKGKKGRVVREAVVETFRLTRVARAQAPQLVEAAADKYAETIDDVLDDILRKLLVTEDLDILQDVEFDEETGSIYLFFDPSLRQEEVKQVHTQLQGAYNELVLVGSPDMSLPEEQAPSDWWVMFLPRNMVEEEAPPMADPSVYSSDPDGSYMKQQIVVPAPVNSPAQIAQSIDIDQAMTNIGGGTAEAVHGLAAASPALAERLLARMKQQRDNLMRSRS